MVSLSKHILSILASTGAKYSATDVTKIPAIARRHPKPGSIPRLLRRFSEATNGEPPLLRRIRERQEICYFCEDRRRVEAYVQGREKRHWTPRALKDLTPTPPISPSMSLPTSIPVTRIVHREVANLILSKSEFARVKKLCKPTKGNGRSTIYKLLRSFFRMIIYEPKGKASFYSEGSIEGWKPEIETFFGTDLANDLEMAYTGRLEGIGRPIRVERGQAIDGSQLPFKLTGKVYINHATGTRTLVRNGDSQTKGEIDFHGPAGPEELADVEKVMQMYAGEWPVVIYNELTGLRTGMGELKSEMVGMRTDFRDMKEKLPDLIGNAVAKAIKKELFGDSEETYKAKKPEKGDFWYG